MWSSPLRLVALLNVLLCIYSFLTIVLQPLHSLLCSLQMNGRRAVKMLLLEEWNQQEGKSFTSKDIIRVMKALNLQQGILTSSQVFT